MLKYSRVDYYYMTRASEIIKEEISSWSGVTIHDHRFGGIEFRLNGREMGHMHGDSIVDLPFPKDVGRRLIAERKAYAHRFVPSSCWISYNMMENGIQGAIELFKMQYNRMTSYSKKDTMSIDRTATTIH